MISLIHPSRARPQQAHTTAKKWIDSAGCPVEHIFSLDLDDGYSKDYQKLDKLIINNNRAVVEAANHAAKQSIGEIITYLSDDFDCFPDWGIRLTEICSKYQGEYLIKVHDGLQQFQAEVLTIPIMSRSLYNRLGYFFHPAYRSMWVDVDLFHTCKNLGVIKEHPELVFFHNHYCNGKAKRDETYNRSDANFETGRAINRQRAREGYPL